MYSKYNIFVTWCPFVTSKAIWYSVLYVYGVSESWMLPDVVNYNYIDVIVLMKNLG